MRKYYQVVETAKCVVALNDGIPAEMPIFIDLEITLGFNTSAPVAVSEEVAISVSLSIVVIRARKLDLIGSIPEPLPPSKPA